MTLPSRPRQTAVSGIVSSKHRGEAPDPLAARKPQGEAEAAPWEASQFGGSYFAEALLEVPAPGTYRQAPTRLERHARIDG